MISERTWTALGLAALCGAGVLSALLEMLLVPLYDGGTLVPITVLITVVGNIALPLLGRELAPNSGWRFSAFVAWSLTVIAINVIPRPEGDVILPGGDRGLEWVGYGVVLGGFMAGIVTTVLTAPRPARPPVKNDAQPVKG